MSPGKTVVVGQGYVGLPIAMRAVDVGYDVVGLDVDDIRVEGLRSGHSHVEDVSAAQLSRALESGRYLPTSNASDAGDFDVAVITVPTPLKDSMPDLSFIKAAATDLAPRLARGATVILESTTYPGTTEELVVPILEELSGLEAGADFHVGYSPERIDPGNTVYGFVNTPKVVSGLGADALDRVRLFYETLVDEVVCVSTTREAELTKLLENTFRHVNIALVNELAIYAKDLGIDVWEAIDAAATKPFGYMKFTPGPGVGGHCLPVDPSYLSWQVRKTLGHSFRFVELANDVNEHMPDYVVTRLTLGLNRQRKTVADSTIALLGLAYKKNTGDARESPSHRVAELLHVLEADLVVCDPFVHDRQVPDYARRADLTAELLESVDAVVLLTDHDAFDYELLQNTTTYVLDTRHRLSSLHTECL